MCLADNIDIDEASNRRIHERLKSNDLRWLKSARLKYGRDVRILDLSAGGVRLEVEDRLEPDANIVVELTASNAILVPARVVRCRPTSFGEVLRYQSACVFKRPLTIPELSKATRLVDAAAARETAAAGSASAWQKVIARYIDGRALSGYTNNFHPSKPQLHLSPNPRQGDSTFVAISQLKALFFVREFLGDPTFVESKAFTEQPQGRKVEITFHDNEVLVGSTLGFRSDGIGFFVRPADSRSNNLRVFVSASGMRQIRFLA